MHDLIPRVASLANESFVKIAGDLKLFSYYEIPPSATGHSSRLVVDKDAAILQLPNEVPISLDTDHGGLTRFQAVHDPSYVDIRNTLAALVDTAMGSRRPDQLKRYRTNLTTRQKTIIDFFLQVDPFQTWKAYAALQRDGTCRWLAQNPTFQEWKTLPSFNLWLSGIPGSGKTILCSHLINELDKEAAPDTALSFFFCDFKDDQTQKPELILASLAAQIAKQNERAFQELQKYYYSLRGNNSQYAKLESNRLCRTILSMAKAFKKSLHYRRRVRRVWPKYPRGCWSIATAGLGRV
ncbi:hypothetical protein F4802DRAFT_180021 [Xylaria palmicola]|nr:hypothetical protein F4802DRAFT_180021 [Xylaria palmicola]